MINPTFIAVDLFCGAGGVTSGYVESGVVKVIACVNHDHKAILSHKYNHPDVKHFEEDIKTMHVEDLVKVVAYWRHIYPNAKLIVHASLECTNHSKAKGGLAKDADSRTLADYLHRYIIALNPDYISIENVVEFLDWGPLKIKPKKKHDDVWELTIIKDKHGKRVYGWEPIPERKGEDFRRWCAEMCAHGYHMDWREIDSADFGASTKRPRLFGMFARTGVNIIWPVKTHTSRERLAKLLVKTPEKPPKKSRKQRVVEADGDGKFFSQPEGPMKKEYFRDIPEVAVDRLQQWAAVKHKIDFSDVGNTIFHRGGNMNLPAKFRKDISPNTFKRVYAGCIKHIAGGEDKFMMKYHGSQDGRTERTSDMEVPLTVIDCNNRHAVINTSFIAQRNSGDPASKTVSLDGPARVITGTGGNQDVVSVHFISKQFGGDPKGKSSSVENPLDVITTVDHNAFITAYHGNGDNTHSVANPGPVIPTGDSQSLVQMQLAFMDKHYTGSTNHQSVEIPLHTILNKDKFSPMFIERPFSGGGQTSDINNPLGTIMPVPKANIFQAEMSFVDSQQYTNKPSSVGDPLPVITANRKWPCLYQGAYGGQYYNINKPCPTIIASQDKEPLKLFVLEEAPDNDQPLDLSKLKVAIAMREMPITRLLVLRGFEYAIPVYEDDDEIVVKLKEFMWLYNIIDIRMRMLKVAELLDIQGFPKNYKLAGNQGDQKKFIGNSVVPDVMAAWALAMHNDLTEQNAMAA